MTTTIVSSSTFTDSELIAEVARLAAKERRATADLIRSLMEFDARRLHLGEGYPSLFAYCTQVLHYAEHAALNRIEVARAARRFPSLLDLVAEGALHITGARLLVPHLTSANCEEVLASARHKSKREIEEIVAGLRPLPAVAPIVRKLPSGPAPVAPPPTSLARQDAVPVAAAPASVAVVMTPPLRASTAPAVAPLAPERYKVQFTITGETRERLRRVQDLLRHAVPDGDPAVIFDRALTLLLEDLERTRFASTTKPRARRPVAGGSRHIPAGVRREVWHRDGGQCAFIGSRGRCSERGFLEFHHVVPFAAGGEATAVNIELRCRGHNAHEAALYFSTAPEGMVRESAEVWG